MQLEESECGRSNVCRCGLKTESQVIYDLSLKAKTCMVIMNMIRILSSDKVIIFLKDHSHCCMKNRL